MKFITARPSWRVRLLQQPRWHSITPSWQRCTLTALITVFDGGLRMHKHLLYPLFTRAPRHSALGVSDVRVCVCARERKNAQNGYI